MRNSKCSIDAMNRGWGPISKNEYDKRISELVAKGIGFGTKGTGKPATINSALNVISSTAASATGSVLQATGQVKKKAEMFLNSVDHIQFYPKTNIPQIIKPFKRVARVGTVVTAVTNVANIATVWTEDKGNTVEQKLIKSCIKAGGAFVSLGAGAVNVTLATACGLAEPETGGLSTAGIIGVATLDVAEGEGINRLQTKLLNNMGIR